MSMPTLTSRRTVASLLIALVVAAPSAFAAPRPATLPWELKGCDALIVLIPAEPAALAPHLPKGFTANVPASVAALLPPDPRLRAVVGLEIFKCASGSVLKGSQDAIDYASFWTFAEPPPGTPGREKYDLTFVKWDTLIPDQPRRDLLARYGLPAQDGKGALDLWGGRTAHPSAYRPDLGPGAFASTWTMGGESYRFAGATGSPVTFRGRFVEYQAGAGGITQWQSRYNAAAATGGSGVVSLHAGGLPARILGVTTAQGYYLVPTGLDFIGQIVLAGKPRR